MKKHLLLAICLITLAVISNAQTTQLWGQTLYGGANSEGTIFSINPNGTGFTTEYNFTPPGGYNPYGNLIQASDGNLYGTCYNGGTFASCTICRYNPNTNNYTDLYSFDITHGDYPRSGVVEALNGILYGASYSGGATSNSGVIYSLDPATSIYTDLYEFVDSSGRDPYCVPIVCNGKLYGVTYGGGINGVGVIYSYDILANTYTDLFDFGSTNGSQPQGSLLLANNGKLYGMTPQGGLNNLGVIFSFDPSNNSFQKLIDFNSSNGAQPLGALMQASDNKLYGVTQYGGTLDDGMIFSFDINTNTCVDLYNFNGTAGSYPVANLLENTNGILYGTASAGGASNAGVIFSFDLSTNTYTDLFDFNVTNGSAPHCGLIAITPPTTTGISKTSTGGIAVYPNPATDKLNINVQDNNFKTATINITNIQGEKVLSFIQDKPQNTIDISMLSKGMYFLEMINNGSKTVMKIAKE